MHFGLGEWSLAAAGSGRQCMSARPDPRSTRSLEGRGILKASGEAVPGPGDAPRTPMPSGVTGHPKIPIMIAAVNAYMRGVAGEFFEIDGLTGFQC